MKIWIRKEFDFVQYELNQFKQEKQKQQQSNIIVYGLNQDKFWQKMKIYGYA